MTVTIDLDVGHGCVILALSAISIHYFIVGFFMALPARSKIFNKEYLQKNFGEIHSSEVGGEIAGGGYPDMGSGRYAEKLSYGDWFRFNNAQRAHYNYLESLPIVLCLGAGAGIQLPWEAFGVLVVYLVARIFYTVGYTMKGPNGRLIGALLGNFCLLGLMGLSIASGVIVVVKGLSSDSSN